MKHRLSFRVQNSKKLLVWARKNDAVYPYTYEPVMNHEQGLWLVKDEGIYLISASNSDGKHLKGAGGKRVVTYARGYDPSMRTICGRKPMLCPVMILRSLFQWVRS